MLQDGCQHGLWQTGALVLVLSCAVMWVSCMALVLVVVLGGVGLFCQFHLSCPAANPIKRDTDNQIK
jgi:hypothetical protein